jgi:hypothetical protein
MLGLTLSGIVTARVFVNVNHTALPRFMVALTVSVPDVADGNPAYHDESKDFVMVPFALALVSDLEPIVYTTSAVSVVKTGAIFVTAFKLLELNAPDSVMVAISASSYELSVIVLLILFALSGPHIEDDPLLHSKYSSKLLPEIVNVHVACV